MTDKNELREQDAEWVKEIESMPKEELLERFKKYEIEPASEEIGNYDHEKVDKALLHQEEPVSEEQVKESTEIQHVKETCKENGKSLTQEPVSKVWHGTNEIPNYVENDSYANSILVFGKTSLGYGASVCHMTTKNTIYTPITDKEYKWGECPFYMWAYISDLLYEKKEPVSEELVEAADFYSKLFSDIAAPYIRKDAFIAGAKWKEEQFEKERLKHCDALTKEQAQIESDFVTQHLKKNNRTPTFIDAIQYGMALQEEKDNICYEEIIEEGAKWKYEQMLKDAITAKVHNLNLVIDSCDIARHIESCKNGDKVKILVIKEDKQ